MPPRQRRQRRRREGDAADATPRPHAARLSLMPLPPPGHYALLLRATLHAIEHAEATPPANTPDTR